MCCSRRVAWDDGTQQTVKDILELRPHEATVLWKAFKAADKDKSGEIGFSELTEFIGIEHTKYAERIFGILDIDGSGCMDFEEFAVAIWNYATFDDEGLRRFAFEVYDTDCGGSLSADEIKNMFSEVCGDEFARSDRAHILLQRVDDMAKHSSTEGVVTPLIFSEFVRRNPGLLLPAFHLQITIKQKIANDRFWNRIQERRAARFADTKDGGWLQIQRDVRKNQIEREKVNPVGQESTNGRPGLSREKRRIMERRQAFMEKAAKRQRPSISANPGEQSEYITVFKNERRERLDVHEQIEYHLRDKVIAEVPHEFLDDAHLFNLWRPLSLNTELGVLQKEAGRIDEFHNMLADIRAKYPRGDTDADGRMVSEYSCEGAKFK